MEKLFLRVLQMSLAGSVVILAVLVLRLPLRRAPRRFSYLLWSGAAFRLCVPISLPSPLSLFRLLRSSGASAELALAPLGLSLPGEAAVSGPAVAVTGTVMPQPVSSAAAPLSWQGVLCRVWLAVLAVLLLYSLLSTLLLRRRLSTAIRERDNLYRADGLGSPFLLGLFRPRIYLPWGLEGKDLDYALAHERCHLRRGDTWFRLLGWLLLCLHWFNPLVWLAYVLMGRDMELSCDEAVLAHLGDVRLEYSESLLHMASGRRSPEPGPAPLAFGETGVGQRVRNALRWKRASGWVTAMAMLLCILFTAAWITDPAGSGTLTLNPDGTVGGLQWGMSLEEALAADGRFSLIEPYNKYYEWAEWKGANILGHTANVTLVFSRRYLEDGLKRGPEGRPVLDEIKIDIPGEVSLTEALIRVFGQQEKRKASENEWDIVDGVPTLHWLPYELPEEKRYWHTDPVYRDIPIEHLRLSIPGFEDTELLGAWCSTFGCTVYVNTFESEDGTLTEVSIFGYGSALQRFLAEEYQRMTGGESNGA